MLQKAAFSLKAGAKVLKIVYSLRFTVYGLEVRVMFLGFFNRKHINSSLFTLHSSLFFVPLRHDKSRSYTY